MPVGVKLAKNVEEEDETVKIIHDEEVKKSMFHASTIELTSRVK
jgi:hypothetical protein